MEKSTLDLLGLEELEDEAMMGDAEAQYKLGKYYYDKEQEDCIDWLAKSAVQGNMHAQCILGKMYLYGDMVEEDEGKAEKLLISSADQGCVEAQFQLGKLYSFSFDINMAEKSYKWYKKASDAGHDEATYGLACNYYYGFGLNRPDYTQAILLFEKAAEQGNEVAYYDLAKIYAEGVEGNQDKEKAIEYLNRAMKKTILYKRSIEVYELLDEKNKEFQLYKAWCEDETDEYQAFFGVAKCYLMGQGVEDNREKANSYFLKVLDLLGESPKESQEQYILGELYENGWGVKKDIEKAKEAYLAAMDGDEIDIREKAREKYYSLCEEVQYIKEISELSLEDYFAEKYEIYGVPFSVDKDMATYYYVKKTARLLVSVYSIAFAKEYDKKIHGIEEYLSQIPELVNSSVDAIRENCSEWLKNKFGICISANNFYDKYMKEIVEEKWADYYEKVLMATLKTCCTTAQYDAVTDMLTKRKGSWLVFSEGGVLGDAKAYAKATALSAGTDIALDVLGGLADVITQAWAEGKMERIFHEKSTRQDYIDAIDNLEDVLIGAFVREIKEASIISELFVDKFDGEGFFQKCINEEGEKSKKYMVFALARNPYKEEYYKYALQHYGDEDGSLTKYAKLIGINILDIKKQCVEEYDLKISVNSTENQINREKFIHYLSFINYNEEEKLNQFDKGVELANSLIEKIEHAEEERRKEYSLAISALWELLFEREQRNSYDQLPDGLKECVCLLCNMRRFDFSFQGYSNRKFKKTVEKYLEDMESTRYYSLFTEDEEGSVKKCAEEGYVFAYNRYAYRLKNDSLGSVESLIYADKARAFGYSNGKDIIDDIVETKANNIFVRLWIEKNMHRFEKDYEVFEGQRDIDIPFTKDIVEKLTDTEAINEIIEKMLLALNEGVEYQRALPVLKVLYEKYLNYCKARLNDRITPEVTRYSNLLKKIYSQIPECLANYSGVIYKSYVNMHSESFYRWFDEYISVCFPIEKEEIPLVFFMDPTASYAEKYTICVTNKYIHYHGQGGKVPLKNVSEIKGSMLGSESIFIINGQKVKREMYTDDNDGLRDAARKYLNKVIQLIRAEMIEEESKEKVSDETVNITDTIKQKLKVIADSNPSFSEVRENSEDEEFLKSWGVCLENPVYICRLCYEFLKEFPKRKVMERIQINAYSDNFLKCLTSLENTVKQKIPDRWVYLVAGDFFWNEITTGLVITDRALYYLKGKQFIIVDLEDIKDISIQGFLSNIVVKSSLNEFKIDSFYIPAGCNDDFMTLLDFTIRCAKVAKLDESIKKCAES